MHLGSKCGYKWFWKNNGTLGHICKVFSISTCPSLFPVTMVFGQCQLAIIWYHAEHSWGCSCQSVAETVSSMCKTLGSLSITTHWKVKDEQINSSKRPSPNCAEAAHASAVENTHLDATNSKTQSRSFAWGFLETIPSLPLCLLSFSFPHPFLSFFLLTMFYITWNIFWK